MEVSEHIEALRRDGGQLSAAAARAGLDTAIPTCPGWTMRDLLRHVGDVHRWAAAHVAERRTEPIRDIEDIAGALPDDADLLDWYREGHASLVGTLEAAAPDVVCWSFLPAPSPLAFWARRQAHETAIHRADAESALGEPAPFDPGFATDGIDELLIGFFGRPVSERLPVEPHSLHLRSTNTADDWVVHVGPEGTTARRGAGPDGGADCSVTGGASELYLLLWNRSGPDGLDVRGNASALTSWRESAQIRWSRER